jgi:hypothetical protein
MNALLDQLTFSSAGAILGIITFFWLELRRELPALQERLSKATTRKRRILVCVLQFAPYVFAAFCFSYVAFQALRPGPIEVKFHKVRLVKSDTDSVFFEERSIVNLFGQAQHFEITLSGAVFGPEGRRIVARFRPGSRPMVYAVVSEESRPSTRSLQWLQVNEGGELDSNGNYTVRAFLGGINPDQAKQGEVFSVRVLIPEDQQAAVRAPSVFDATSPLPRHVFLSEPVYVRVLRQRAS